MHVLKYLFAFSGRMSRKDYNLYMLGFIVYYILAFCILIFLENLEFFLFFVTIGLVSAFAQSFKRVQDIGLPGWYALTGYFGFYGMIKPGQKGPNKYGPDPLEKKKS